MKFVKITILLFLILLFPTVSAQTGEEIIVTDADSVWSSDLISASSDVIDSTDALPENLITYAFISHADSVWHSELTSASPDVVDSTDALLQNLIKYAFVSHADSVWNSELISPSSDVLDSTDAPEKNLIKWAFVSHADSVLNIGLEAGEWEVKPDFWIERIRPVQVVWDSKIDDNDTIDLVAGKSTMVRVEVGMENYEALDKDTPLEIKLFLPEPGGDFMIPRTFYPTIEQLLAMNKQIDVYLDFDLPLGNHTITAEVYPLSEIEESDLSNNEDSVDITVKDTNGLNIRYFRVERPGSYGPPQYSYYPYRDTAEKSAEFIQATYPIANGVLYPVRENTVRNEILLGHEKQIIPVIGILWDSISISTEAKRLGVDRGIGVVPYGYFDYHGVEASGFSFGPIVKGVVAEAGYWATPAHEIGHTYGLRWPIEEYTDTYEGNPASGFWVARQENMENKICFMRKHQEYEHESFNTTWIDGEDYSYLFKKFRKIQSDPEILVVNGIIYGDSTIELGKWYRVKEGMDDLGELIPGDYALQILDKDGNILQEISFSADFFTSKGVNEQIETDFAPFSFAVPYFENTSIVKILYQNKTIVELNLTEKLMHDAMDTLPSDYDMLINSIEEVNIQHGIKNSLLNKLDNAKKKAEQGINYINEGNYTLGKNMLNSASNIVNAFINEVNTQKGKKISEEDANGFITWAEKMILALQNQIIKNL